MGTLGRRGKFEAYIFDVEEMRCENIDSDHEGPLRLAWVKPEELTASFTGQIPGAKKKEPKSKRRANSDAFKA